MFNLMYWLSLLLNNKTDNPSRSCYELYHDLNLIFGRLMSCWTVGLDGRSAVKSLIWTLSYFIESEPYPRFKVNVDLNPDVPDELANQHIFISRKQPTFPFTHIVLLKTYNLWVKFYGKRLEVLIACYVKNTTIILRILLTQNMEWSKNSVAQL